MSNAETTELTISTEQVITDIENWDAITDHRTATPGDAATDSWMRQQIETVGLTAKIERYDFARVDINECWIEIDGERIPGVPMFDGPSTGRAALEGIIGDDIAIMASSPNDRHQYTRALQSARAQHQSRGIVALSAAADVQPGLALLNAEHYRAPMGPPVIQISSEHAERFANADRKTAALMVDFSRTNTQATNVQTTIQGSDPSSSPVVIMTPKTAWWTCTAERVGGIVVWLTLMRHFAVHRPKRDVIFTANSGHELSHLGLDHFVQQNSNLMQGAHAWVHLGANFAAAEGHVRLQASTEALATKLTQSMTTAGVQTPSVTPVGDRPFGEARNVFDGGGEFISILGGNPWFHRPDDRWPQSINLKLTAAINTAFVNLMRDICGVSGASASRFV